MFVTNPIDHHGQQCLGVLLVYCCCNKSSVVWILLVLLMVKTICANWPQICKFLWMMFEQILSNLCLTQRKSEYFMKQQWLLWLADWVYILLSKYFVTYVFVFTSIINNYEDVTVKLSFWDPYLEKLLYLCFLILLRQMSKYLSIMSDVSDKSRHMSDCSQCCSVYCSLNINILMLVQWRWSSQVLMSKLSVGNW